MDGVPANVRAYCTVAITRDGRIVIRGEGMDEPLVYYMLGKAKAELLQKIKEDAARGGPPIVVAPPGLKL